MRTWLVAILCLTGVSANHAADWIFAPSDYTHNPSTGKRIDQYAAPPPQYVYTQPNYARSVYRYERSSLQVGDSIDNLHIVNSAGPAFAPYRTWQLPFRPYAVPYDAWGPQVPGGFGGGAFGPYGAFGPGVGFGGPGFGGPGFGGPGFGGPGYGGPGGGGYGAGPWGPVDGFGGQVNPYAPGAGPWGGTFTLPRGPLDPRSGVFGPTEQQEWFDKNSHGPLINPNIPYPGQQKFFPQSGGGHHHHHDSSKGPT